MLLHQQHFADLERAVSVGDARVRASLGWFFEGAVNLDLPRGGEFPRRHLTERRKDDNLILAPRQAVRAPGNLTQFLRASAAGIARGTYWIPPTGMALFNAVEGGTKELYKTTLDIEHKLAEGPLREAVKVTVANKREKLVINWVVPDFVLCDHQGLHPDPRCLILRYFSAKPGLT